MAGSTSHAGAAGGTGSAPTKTKLVSILFVLFGLVLTIGGLAVVGLSSYVNEFVPGFLGGLGTAIALIFLVLAAVTFALAYGLWTVTEWGWYGAVVVLVLGIVNGVYTLLQGGSGEVVGVVVSAVAVWALWDEQDAFGLDHELPF